MRIRHLRIRVNTEKGMHGVDIVFPDGLVVIRADNSMGKSTCIQSILVGLGLEAMITTSQRDLPLPHVMKEELDSNGESAHVLESDIFIEIENIKKEHIVVHRTVKGNRSKDLISVIFGPALTNEFSAYPSEDFFVSRSGAATHEKGFHHFLSEFLNWKLPEVATFDGQQCPLYIQSVFPYFVVEQKRGWASLTPPIPTQFRIREPHKRAIEFLLNLDAYNIAAKRIELSNISKDIESEWLVVIREVRTLVEAIGGIINRLPERPISNWPPEIAPFVQTYYENNWIPLESLLEKRRSELQELYEKEIPTVREISVTANDDLLKAQENLREKELNLSQLLNSLELERGEVRSIQTRLAKLDEDIQRNKDIRTLLSLGSKIAPNISLSTCPTCHQPIQDTLTPLAESQNVMPVDENIAFLLEQRETFLAVLRNANAILEARVSQVSQLHNEIANERAKIRSIRQTLISDDRLPSMEVIRKRVELEEYINRQAVLIERLEFAIGKLEPLAEKWFEVQSEKEKLPKGDASEGDISKLRKWNKAVVDQLKDYDFKSLMPDSVFISSDTYKPIHEGFELDTNISASDFIRIIWSYLTGLLEVSHDYETNHPGLLIFDEPKQQSAKEISFAALLTRASESIKHHQQVIFATSENRENLQNILKDIPHSFIEG